MSHGPCDCCDQPICNTPTIICDSVSASKTKCGFAPYTGDTSPVATRYTTQTAHTEIHTANDSGSCHAIMDVTTVQDCINGVTCSGGCNNSGATVPPYTHTWVPSGAACDFDSSSFSPCCNFGSTTISTSATSQVITSSIGSCPAGSSQVVTKTLSTLYTTDQLKTNTEDALPDYSGFDDDHSVSGQGITCSAFRGLSADETSHSIRRFKYKVRHYPTASCYLRVWLRLRFRPAGTSGASDVLTDVDAYEWTGSPTDGGLCFKDATLPYDHADNRIDSAASDEIAEPDDNGTTTIEIKKWSCLEGYEPDDPNDDGTRPDPDDNPNGWPKPA